MKGIIYKITSPSTDKIYIGSTIQPLMERLYHHRSHLNNTTSNLIISFNDAVIECIEEVEFDTKKKLHDRERYYIQLNRDKCVNKVIPSRTMKEYEVDNRDKRKQYRIRNADEVKERTKQYYRDNADRLNAKIICECGGKHTFKHKSTHLKSNKHQKYISSNI